MIIKTVIFGLLAVFFVPSFSYGYIDPGIGGMIFQIFGFIFFSLIAFWFGLWKKGKMLIMSLFKIGSKNKDSE